MKENARITIAKAFGEGQFWNGEPQNVIDHFNQRKLFDNILHTHM
jgi:hypothetical protein